MTRKQVRGMGWGRVAAALLLVGGGVACAEFEVGIRAERSDYLLFEPILVDIALRNNTGHETLVHGTSQEPWLQFLINRRSDNSTVRPDRTREFPEVPLKPEETRYFRVDVTPLYNLREPGEYLIRAVVTISGQMPVMSAPVYVRLADGQVVWKETRPLEGSERTFSLLRFSPTSNSSSLYLRVEDLRENLVFSTAPLGAITHILTPQVFWDKEGYLHVLHTVGNGEYRYNRATDRGRLVHRTIYDSNPMYPPRLVRQDDGIVTVVGGKARVQTPRERLSDATFGETAAAPAAPVLPEGKKAEAAATAAQLQQQAAQMSASQLPRPESSADVFAPLPQAEPAELPTQ